jgi:protoporphyrinogen IX oxidase
MTGFLGAAYPWIEGWHIVAVISWMAGLLYLPRLFVYHAGVPFGSRRAAMLEVMERRLLRGIMWPALAMTYGFGAALLADLSPGIWHAGWVWAKLALVGLLTVYHLLLGRWRRDFAAGNFSRSPRFYRIVNEIPTLIMIAIVLLVTAKPF